MSRIFIRNVESFNLIFGGCCSFGGVVKKFNDLKYMTDISHTVSTGNKKFDKTIAKVGAGILGKAIKSPQGKAILYGAKIAYPYVETGSANIARAKVTYDETCKRKK